MSGSKYNKLLYPTDFSDQSVHLLGVILQDEKFHKTDIYVLHAFRLISGQTENTNLVAAKRMLEQNSSKAFDKLDHDLFDKINHPHHFLSDVGFLSDRIASNIKDHKIDLLVLCNRMRNELMKKENLPTNHFLHTVTCDVMLVPENQIIVDNHYSG